MAKSKMEGDKVLSRNRLPQGVQVYPKAAETPGETVELEQSDAVGDGVKGFTWDGLGAGVPPWFRKTGGERGLSADDGTPRRMGYCP